ncbi:hypothetical protein GCM10027416_06320 [Okibacterium endophyticum]
MSVYTASPIRHPDPRSPQVMTKRAWWLVVLNFLIPGSAQSLAGSRRLARLGLGATLALWAFAVITVVLYLVWPTVVYTLATNSLVLLAAQAVLIAYAVLWVVLTVDTLRLVRIVKAAPSARFWIAALTVVLLVVSAGGATAGVYYAGVTRGALSSIFGGGAAAEPPVDGRYNILLLGGDAGPDRDGLRPDSLTVVSIDADTGEAVMIGLPRDMEYVPFAEDSPFYERYPDGYQSCDVSACKLNSVYTEAEVVHPDWYPDAAARGSAPGIEATKDAAEGITGLTIQYYVLIDMQGFSDLVDALGGVTINVTERVPLGGDENLNGVAEWFEPGEQHMDGYHALWYARSRHGDSDYARMERQRQLQEAILRQFTPANVLSKFQVIAEAGAQVVKTDIPESMLGYFTDLAMKTKELPISAIELTPANDIDPENPDFAAIRELINSTLHPPTDEPGEG